MVVVLFRSKLVAEPEGYGEMAEEMEALARTMPGFIDVKAYLSEDGERLTVVRWQDQETMRKWREQERHRVAQRAGRERWYEYYKLEVAEVVRETSFTRRDFAAASGSA
jgi:heme-degrading monooxygenase HmoA